MMTALVKRPLYGLYVMPKALRKQEIKRTLLIFAVVFLILFPTFFFHIGLGFALEEALVPLAGLAYLYRVGNAYTLKNGLSDRVKDTSLGTLMLAPLKSGPLASLKRLFRKHPPV